MPRPRAFGQTASFLISLALPASAWAEDPLPPPPPPEASPPPRPVGFVAPRPPDILLAQGDESPPPGYRVVQKRNYVLAAAGGAILFTSYLSYMFVGLLGEAFEGVTKYKVETWPLFVPIAGPYLAIGVYDLRGVSAAMSVLGGLVQATGATLGIVGLVLPGPRKFHRNTRLDLRVAPLVTGGVRGVAFEGSF